MAGPDRRRHLLHSAGGAPRDGSWHGRTCDSARVPALVAVLYGIKPVVLAIIVQAIWRLGRTALTTPRTIAIAVLSVIASTLGVHELIVLAGAALSGLATTWRRQTGLPILLPWDWSSAWRSSHWPLAIAATGVAGSVGLWPLFGVFLKIGSVLFGSGYVLLAFLRADLVERYHWITERQLLDAIAVGQVTPGPLFTSATFIGYVIGGLPGAAVATIGIFLPAFIFVALSGRSCRNSVRIARPPDCSTD